MTPEQIKAERQLSWMKANLPPIPGESLNLQKKRREKLVKLLGLLSADANGCIFYKDAATSRPPNIEWPNRDKFEEDKRTQPIAARFFCVWPKSECKRRPAQKITARCGNKKCVNLSHRIDLKLWNANKLQGRVMGFERKFSREAVREAVRLRLEELCSLTDIEAKTGINTSTMSLILHRKVYTRYTGDLLEGVELPKRCKSR